MGAESENDWLLSVLALRGVQISNFSENGTFFTEEYLNENNDVEISSGRLSNPFMHLVVPEQQFHRPFS